MDITGSLGLENVESDPNYLPPRTDFPGVVRQSEHVKPRNKEHLSHVITYEVTDGQYKGKTQAEWFRLGIPQYDDNQNLVGLENTMSEMAKSFYRRRLESLGVPESRFAGFKPEDVIAVKVNFSVRHKDGFQNIANVELQTEPTNDPQEFANSAVSNEAPDTNQAAEVPQQATGTPGEL